MAKKKSAARKASNFSNGGKQKTHSTTKHTTDNAINQQSTQKRREPRDKQVADVIFHPKVNDRETFKFHKVYAGSGSLVFIRTDRLPLPVGGKYGCILVVDYKTQKLVSARYADWEEWQAIKESEKLTKVQNLNFAEVKVSAIQKALGFRMTVKKMLNREEAHDYSYT